MVKEKIVHAFNEAGPEYIPMAGETISEQGFPLEGSLNLPVRMVRSLAAIEVSLADDVSFDWQEKFILQSMHAVRVNSHLQVIHNECNEEHVVEAPSIPVVAANNVVTERIAVPAGVNNAVTLAGLYLPESEVCMDAQSQEEEATCIIIGGICLGDNPANTKTSYYRVDIKNTAGEEFGQVLRNHKYYITVHDVLNEGSIDPDDAETELVLTLEVYDWLEDDNTNIVYGPDNKYLALSPNDVTVAYFIGAERTVEIKTNYDNYTIEWIAEDGTVKSAAVGVGEGSVTTEYFTIENNGGFLHIIAIQENSGNNATERYEYLQIKAGDITARMKITQLAQNFYKRTYVSIFSPLGLQGNLGDDILYAGQNDGDAVATVLRNFFKNEDYFGDEDTLSFGGFTLSALPLTGTDVKINAQMADLFDGILIPYLFNCSANQAQILINWLGRSNQNRVLMVYSHETTLINALGNSTKSISISSGQKYLLSTDTPDFIADGPFGKVDLNSGLSAIMETAGNITVLDISDNSNSGIKPILVNSANPNEVIFGIDPERRIIYMGDPYLFSAESQYEHVAGLFSENGVIALGRTPDILLTNLIAWIAETVIGEELAPRE